MQPRLELSLAPDVLEVWLQQEPDGPCAARLSSLWHRVAPSAGLLATLESREGEPLTVRLSVRGQSPAWQAGWLRWAPDRAPDEGTRLEGEDLVLGLPPGGRRTAVLEGRARLDGETLAGDYGFAVVATEEASGAPLTAPGELRLRHPSAALLQYLPSIYSPPDGARREGMPYEDPPFFARFLRGFEDALGPMQALLDQMERIVDPAAAPADLLPWLATWVALVLDESWPELKRRRLIREATELYRWRGTRRGLARYLEIYTGHTPEIVDRPFHGMRLAEDARLGRSTTLGDIPAHTFVVTLAVPDPEAVSEQMVRDIIEAEKPAHAAYDLRIVWRPQE